ncbi:polysaccharide deacetylase family protein [uncultured Maricaulis sp.]|uniref:polysaccharide deacetylase family protein n=1 Tax=uncultured Maricaulis sp. TaxID=174710 RepID=UPI0030DD7DE0|tara:strand:- start:201622 stop:202551 length:930 start_codon:yes stop_codon:yes gene_type:complete
MFGLALMAGLGPIAAAQEPTPRGRIALSFDDAPRGPGPLYSGTERAEVLLASLRAVNAPPVVFFVKTEGLDTEEGRSRIRAYADAGHLIANHTNSHPWLSRTDADAYIAEIDLAETRLDGLPNRRPWFRFPYLDQGTPLEKRDAVRAALTERGLRNGYVTVDDYDWYIESLWQAAVRSGRQVDQAALGAAYVEIILGAVDFYDAQALTALGRSPAHVILLHENDLAAEFIDELIVALRAAGWTLISPDEAYADSIAAIEPETLMTRQGQVGALAVQAGIEPATLTHRAIEEAQIEAFLEERHVFSSPDH